MARAVSISVRGGPVVCDRCVLADDVLLRVRGLIGRRSLDSGAGLLLKPAPAIHTYFMRFPIDAVFIDRGFNVLKVVEDLRPWRMAHCRKARMVLELSAGEARRRSIVPGVQLEVAGAAS
jgi:uncharacterized membrane protein (UPF0127 family)